MADTRDRINARGADLTKAIEMRDAKHTSVILSALMSEVTELDGSCFRQREFNSFVCQQLDDVIQKDERTFLQEVTLDKKLLVYLHMHDSFPLLIFLAAKHGKKEIVDFLLKALTTIDTYSERKLKTLVATLQAAFSGPNPNLDIVDSLTKSAAAINRRREIWASYVESCLPSADEKTIPNEAARVCLQALYFLELHVESKLPGLRRNISTSTAEYSKQTGDSLKKYYQSKIDDDRKALSTNLRNMTHHMDMMLAKGHQDKFSRVTPRKMGDLVKAVDDTLVQLGKDDADHFDTALAEFFPSPRAQNYVRIVIHFNKFHEAKEASAKDNNYRVLVNSLHYLNMDDKEIMNDFGSVLRVAREYYLDGRNRDRLNKYSDDLRTKAGRGTDSSPPPDPIYDFKYCCYEKEAEKILPHYRRAMRSPVFAHFLPENKMVEKLIAKEKAEAERAIKASAPLAPPASLLEEQPVSASANLKLDQLSSTNSNLPSVIPTPSIASAPSSPPGGLVTVGSSSDVVVGGMPSCKSDPDHGTAVAQPFAASRVVHNDVPAAAAVVASVNIEDYGQSKMSAEKGVSMQPCFDNMSDNAVRDLLREGYEHLAKAKQCFDVATTALMNQSRAQRQLQPVSFGLPNQSTGFFVRGNEAVPLAPAAASTPRLIVT